jgi:hypothetical protein
MFWDAEQYFVIMFSSHSENKRMLLLRLELLSCADMKTEKVFLFLFGKYFAFEASVTNHSCFL